MKAFETWTALPHGPLEPLAEDLWRVEGSLPNMPLRRVLTIARLASGELVLHNPIALADDTMAELESLGRPAWLIAPNGWHRLDARVYAERYPAAKVLCPPGARKKVAEVCRVDGTYADFVDDPRVKLHLLDGVAGVEGVLEVRSSPAGGAGQGGTTLVFNDAIFNQPHLPGLFGFIYRLIGSSGPPKVPRLIRLAMIKDKRAFRAHLERLADTPDLRRVVVSHTALIDSEPARILREIAASL
jgi:hypothetical protein